MDLLRNALAAAPLDEQQRSHPELSVLQTLTEQLLSTNKMDELAAIVPRYLAAGKAMSRDKGRLSEAELRSLYVSARFHEVLSYSTLPNPTLPYPTQTIPTLPYPTLPYPTLPYPTLPYLTPPHSTLAYP